MNPENWHFCCCFFTKNMKQHNCFQRWNVSWAENRHIRMISEGSRDTEDWRNDAENSALLHENKLHFQIYSNRKQLF